MIQRAISLFTAGITLSVYLWSQLQPNDALFLFATANLIINIGLIGLTALTVNLSFIDKFKRPWTYAASLVGAVTCLSISVAGLLFSGLSNKVLPIFGPLDFLILAEAGIVMGICCLTYAHQPLKLHRLAVRPPRQPVFKPSFSLPKLAFHSFKHVRFS